MTTCMEQLKSDILKVAKEHPEASLDNFREWLLNDGEQVTQNYDSELSKKDITYYNNNELSKKQVFSDFSTVANVLDSLLDDNLIEENTIINNLTAENWGFFDALARRYLVDTAFNEVKDDLKNILS